VARGEIRERLLAALGRLSPVQRDVVLMADLEELSHVEIAERMRISEMMSRRHLSDARRRLRVLLASDKP
jgi:RNA polymerase sigma factor (sigma-70 family)